MSITLKITWGGGGNGRNIGMRTTTATVRGHHEAQQVYAETTCSSCTGLCRSSCIVVQVQGVPDISLFLVLVNSWGVGGRCHRWLLLPLNGTLHNMRQAAAPVLPVIKLLLPSTPAKCP
jgi:hypothetical protein